MTSRLPSTALTQLVPLLGSLARLIADGAQLDDMQFQVLLEAADLDHDPAALEELRRWGRLLSRLASQPRADLRRVTIEGLQLRGVPEASALLAVATISDRATITTNAPASTPLPPSPSQLQVHPERLDFGTLMSDQPVIAKLMIQGGPGQIVVESDYLRVTPSQFGAEPTEIQLEVHPLAGGLLWTSLRLVTAGATVEVPVIAQWAADTSHQTGATLVVTPGASEEESGTRLTEAILAATAGAVVHVSAGTYRLAQPLMVDKPLTFIGEGQDQTRLLCAAEEYVAHFSGDGPFVIADLSFEHIGTAWARVVQVHGGEIDIQRCSFKGGVLDAVRQTGGSGLYLYGQTRGLIRQCEARGNVIGISVDEQAQPTLEGNTCQQNQWSGIAYFDSAGGTARKNICSSNTKYGISVNAQAQPTLEGNTCQQNQWSGIGYRDSAGGTARQNTCSSNTTHGIYVGAQAQPTLEGNTCQQNKDTGITYRDSAGGTARQNTCTGNTQYGIYVGEQAQPTLEANTCQQNQLTGIGYGGSAGGTARQNTCTGNTKNGIYIGAQAQPTLEGNTCQQNQWSGIAYFDSAGGTARKNICSSNTKYGISVNAQAQPTLEGNTCQQNQWSG
ncbi:right-handed parallel beta-helix repeat-containing protein, partial [Candidatus Chloroploca sp. M-50]